MNFKLRPSDFAFLWEGCKRCFYLQVVHNIEQPSKPMPKIFNAIDSTMNKYFAGRKTSEISKELPPGIIEYGQKAVVSEAIKLPNHISECYISGRFDTAVKFEDGGYGVIDFKTSETNSEYLPYYSRQLHAYAYALEHPAVGKMSLSPISKLGLLCIEPTEMTKLDGICVYQAEPVWVEFKKNEKGFISFLEEIMDVLDNSKPPQGNPECKWCNYIDNIFKNDFLPKYPVI